MAEGLVTFFEYKKLGFYQRGTDYSEPLGMDELLSDMLQWHNERVSLEDTLPWSEETPGYNGRKKVYLKSIERNPDTGDYLMILWRAVGSGDGIYGMRSNAALDDDRLYNANDAAEGENVIWGEALYYWFIPEMNVFASIKFPRSVSDTLLCNRYISAFVELQSSIRQRVVERKESTNGTAYLSVHFQGDNGNNLWFRAESQQYRKLTKGADLNRIADDIESFVKRDVVSAQVMRESGWERFCRNLPFMSSEVTRDTRRVEISIDAKPTAEELANILETYSEEYAGRRDGDWSNIGFKKKGVGGICWLNEFVVKNILHVPDIAQGDDSGHYSAQRLFAALVFRRENLLAPFTLGVMEAQLDEVAL
ncbi:hypothetical protein [Aeromonas dhakensis]|uniref:hypothetical protein n=1 Tax=Aeromonas dhakensis TaxID=196024 RepID=UPI002378F577|nr:hypothetical protein [Aeromonas dhakensis]MDD9210806.1 hypothetical protein [Aeromonas dhakensis]